MNKLVVLLLLTFAFVHAANARVFFVCYKGQGYIINTVGNSLNPDGPSTPAGGCPGLDNYVIELTAKISNPSTGQGPVEIDPDVYANLKKADFSHQVDAPQGALALLRQSSIPLQYADPKKLEPKVRNLLKRDEQEIKKENK